MIPGTSEVTRSPRRRATRMITRSKWVSSSLVPRITWRITSTAEITSAASNAQPNESTLIEDESMSDRE